MSDVAKVPHSNKIMLSQPITSIKIKYSYKKMNKNSNGLSKHISSSKYVAEQRAKARDIVLCLQRKNIKLIAIDFDKTLLSIHTSGYYKGTAENLLEYIRSTFTRRHTYSSI